MVATMSPFFFMRNLIYQVNIIQGEDTYADCIKSVAAYCKKYDIEHIVQTEPLLKIKPKTNYRNQKYLESPNDSNNRFHTVHVPYLLIYEKENAFDLLHSYDNICILDRDILIRHFAPNIFDEIEDYEFAGVLENDLPALPGKISDFFPRSRKRLSIQQFYPLKDEADFKWTINGASYYNCGMMLLSNKIKRHFEKENARYFLGRKEFERFIEGENYWYLSTEQTLINFWLRKYKIKTKDLSWKWNAFYGILDMKTINEAFFVHFFQDMKYLPSKNIYESGLENLK